MSLFKKDQWPESVTTANVQSRVEWAVVQHAHWELFEVKNGHEIKYLYRCSNCHTKKPYDISPYCCGCGAKMDEVSECRG